MPRPVQIGERYFESLKAAKDYIRGIHNDRYSVGDQILPGNPDYQFLLDLLEMHPNSEEKIGNGVIGFKIIRPADVKSQTRINYDNRGFQVTRADDSVVDFSYTKIFKTRGSKDLIHDALRNIVEPLRRDRRELLAKEQYPGEPYSAFGLRYTSLSFRALADEFLNVHPEITEDSFTSPEVLQVRREFNDPELTSAWQMFWKENAEVTLYRLPRNAEP